MNVKMLLSLMAFTLLISAASAISWTVPETVGLGGEFKISVETESPAVLGVAVSIPDGFRVLNCSTSHRVSKDLFIALVNETKAECTLVAPKNEGVFQLNGKWFDLLKGKEGDFSATILVGEEKGKEKEESQTEAATAKTEITAKTTATTTATISQKAPGFEFLAAILSLLIAVRWLK